MARASVLAIALLATGCGQGFITPVPVPSAAIVSASPSGVTEPTPQRVASASPASGIASCDGPFSAPPAPPYAFPTVKIPAGSDACYVSGEFGHPQPFQLTNDGSLVAFTGRDEAHQRDLWLGDLAKGTVRLAYEADEPAGTKVELWYPQMVAGTMVWLERVHDGTSLTAPLKEWAIKKLDVASGEISTLKHETGIAYGGRVAVDPLRYDGHRLALGEGTGGTGWQIEVIDLRDGSSTIVPCDRSLYDVALVEDGIIYTAGTNDAKHDSIGDMRTYLWTKATGSREVGSKSFDLAADGKTVAWINDPFSSDHSTGKPATPRLALALPPYTDQTFLSPEPNGRPTVGVQRIAIGSGVVAWWENELTPAGAAEFALTVWQPEWASPVQVETSGTSPLLSVNGGWLVWFEFDSKDIGRLRGVPLSVLDDKSHTT